MKKIRSFMVFLLFFSSFSVTVNAESSYFSKITRSFVALLFGKDFADSYFNSKIASVGQGSESVDTKPVDTRSVNALPVPHEARHNNKFVFFWQVPDDVIKGKKEASYSESCFSQWYPSPFSAFNPTGRPKEFKTAEHFMMYFKALHFNNEAIANDILESATGEAAKNLGRKVPGVNPTTWDDAALFYVYAGNMEKFSQNQALKMYLLNTGDAILVEASPYDKVWGIGLKKDSPDARDKSKWRGKNKLGSILMMVRSELQKNVPFRPALNMTNIPEFVYAVKNYQQSKMMNEWRDKRYNEYKDLFVE